MSDESNPPQSPLENAVAWLLVTFSGVILLMFLASDYSGLRRSRFDYGSDNDSLASRWSDTIESGFGLSIAMATLLAFAMFLRSLLPEYLPRLIFTVNRPSQLSGWFHGILLVAVSATACAVSGEVAQLSGQRVGKPLTLLVFAGVLWLYAIEVWAMRGGVRQVWPTLAGVYVVMWSFRIPAIAVILSITASLLLVTLMFTRWILIFRRYHLYPARKDVDP